MTADLISRLSPEEVERRINDAYHPCRNGVHVCGVSSELASHEYPVTLANFRSSHPRDAWERGRQFAVPHAEADLVVDLVIDDDIAEDYSIRRQDLPALLRALEVKP